MRERPILFSSAMVRAILAGTKTQTRRVVKPQPGDDIDNLGDSSTIIDMANGGRVIRCPYGAPGDALWVREEHYRFGHWEFVPGVKTKAGRMKWRFVADSDELRFDAPESYRKGRHHKDPFAPAWHKRLARFMPRAFSRITLEVTGVRVETLHGIGARDAVAEGVIDDAHGWDGNPAYPLARFRSLWIDINGQESWDANPWVWVVEFRRIEAAERAA